jgi:16S rRNA (uracil1498-N3)-methyltransferase
MRSYLLPEGFQGEKQLEISGAGHRHLCRVLRCRVGDTIPATDGRGGEYLLRVRRIGPDRLVAGVEREEPGGDGPPGGTTLTLLQCLPKGNRMDLIVRQATEAGVDRIVPLLSRYTVPRWTSREDAAGRVERWNRIAREALQQSGRSRLPRVLEPVSLEGYLAAPAAGTRLFLHQETLEDRTLHALLADAGSEVSLLVGPEGGLSGGEVRLLLGRGFSPVHLPGAVLRSETAALFALAATWIILKEINAWKPVQ